MAAGRGAFRGVALRLAGLPLVTRVFGVRMGVEW